MRRENPTESASWDNATDQVVAVAVNGALGAPTRSRAGLSLRSVSCPSPVSPRSLSRGRRDDDVGGDEALTIGGPLSLAA
jgi:hypothetical protein